ncbi:hypothetical protein BBJ28_00002137 [Nothophytophthora sp. Chile5]|nr:hypothetical protein BBJ28_00002137 [Nothophytophthora sp. Chile5]
MASLDGAAAVRSSLAPTELEREHVHKVYDRIAPHFSHTRHHPWPLVTAFLAALPLGSLVADIGCGNGKYLRVNPALCMVGGDRSLPLLRTGASFDQYVALDGHLRTSRPAADAHPVRLVELARLVRVGGQVLIVAWAFEQDARSKRRFEQQDVMVEWKLQQKYAKHEELAEDGDGEAEASHGRADCEKRWVVYERYCHVYCAGELEALVAQVPGIELVSVEYSRSNWCLRLARVA